MQLPGLDVHPVTVVAASVHDLDHQVLADWVASANHRRATLPKPLDVEDVEAVGLRRIDGFAQRLCHALRVVALVPEGDAQLPAAAYVAAR